MTITEVKYDREFESGEGQIDTSYHGSPDWENVSLVSKEDYEIREEAQRRFGLKMDKTLKDRTSAYEIRENTINGEGFDGKQQYLFTIEGRPITDRPYTTTATIKKAGDEQTLEDPCDLEKFLIEKGFKSK